MEVILNFQGSNLLFPNILPNIVSAKLFVHLLAPRAVSLAVAAGPGMCTSHPTLKATTRRI